MQFPDGHVINWNAVVTFISAHIYSQSLLPSYMACDKLDCLPLENCFLRLAMNVALTQLLAYAFTTPFKIGSVCVLKVYYSKAFSHADYLSHIYKKCCPLIHNHEYNGLTCQ